jgi:DNA-binding LytR/AlgR family response regulator
MKKLTILIVEDEILIAEMISEYLAEAGHRTLNIAISYDEALKEYNLFKPDLILLDIRLYGEKSGIDFARYLESQNEKTPVIFLSSQYDQRTMAQALDTNPYGYLTKPIRKESLWTTVHAAYGLYESKFLATEEIQLFDGKMNFKVKISDILYIEADHVYLNVFLTNGKVITIRYTLKQLLSELPQELMIQCHRSYIINKMYMLSWKTTHITLKNNKEIPVSRNYRNSAIG